MTADEHGLSRAPQAPPPRREWRLPAEPDNVPRARRAVREFAVSHGAMDPAVGNLSLAVTEAVTNAVLHAYIGCDAGEVLVVAQASADEVVICVLDDGRGMQPRPDSPGLGMGLPMIGQLTTSVDIRERPGGGTEVRMRFHAPGVRGPVATAAEADPRMQLLVEVARLAQAGGWPQQGVGRLVHLLVPALADACAIVRVTPAGLERLAEVGPAAPPLDGLPLDTGVALVDVPAPAADGLAWWVVIPLHENDRALGLLLLGLTAERGRPDAQDLVFLETLGERAARGLAANAEHAAPRRRLDGILDALAEAVTVNDADGRTVWANEAAARLLGADTIEDVLSAAPGQLAALFLMTLEDGRPVGLDDLPGRRLLAGLDAPPLLTRSVLRATGQERWLVTKASLLEEAGERLAVNIIEDVTAAKRDELRTRFLAHAGEVLGASLDPERTLRDLAALIVPGLADWCAIDLLSEDGALQRVAVEHADPERVAFAAEIDRLYPSAPGEVMQSLLAGGPPVVLAEITDELLRSRARDPQHLELLRGLGVRSALVVPLVAGEAVIGLLTLLTAESGRTFSESDVAFGADVGRRAGTAVENARRYAERPS
jgi:GAF domain-containing protein